MVWMIRSTLSTLTKQTLGPVGRGCGGSNSTGEGAVAASPQEGPGEVSASEVLLISAGRWPQGETHSGDFADVGFDDGDAAASREGHLLSLSNR
jgi:hypothetical protein